MVELIRTNDAVAISFVVALLNDSGIGHAVMDQHMSVLEGSVGILPRRIMVDAEMEPVARRLVKDAGLGKFLTHDD